MKYRSFTFLENSIIYFSPVPPKEFPYFLVHCVCIACLICAKAFKVYAKDEGSLSLAFSQAAEKYDF